jgi:phenylalanyl-tRNA synthetase beta chain
MKISYNWLQNYFDEKLPDPEKISDGVIFHSFEVEDIKKVEDDTIFDIKILPDRAHDCLSHFGIAKEISVIFDLKMKDKEYKIFDSKETKLEIKIEDDKCLRYMGRIIRNIKVGPSPAWLVEKLESIGQKSINNVVDAANFVMFDFGQPIHAFDLDKMESSKEEVVSIKVRKGKVGEKITTLDKKEIELDEGILIIADDKDPLAIAGIKGGTKAEVDNNTKNIIIEVANFNPTTTRKTAKKINIQTDAIKRYENEISPELCSLVMDEISQVIFSLAGGEVEDIVDVYPKKQEDRYISVGVEYINKRLGSSFAKEQISNVWDKLKFIYEIKDNNFEVKIPELRLDLTGPHDLVEEVIRILGYDSLEEKLPNIKKEEKINKEYNNMTRARQKLLNDGYSEVMTYVFRDSGEVEVLASASDKKFLRNNLIDGLKESIRLNSLNIPLLDMKEIKVFEIGTVFKKDKEEMHVAYGDKKNIIEMPLSEFSKKELLNDGIQLNLEKKDKDNKFSNLGQYIHSSLGMWLFGYQVE